MPAAARAAGVRQGVKIGATGDLRVVVERVREGRTTFANTLKYVFTTPSANFATMTTR